MITMLMGWLALAGWTAAATGPKPVDKTTVQVSLEGDCAMDTLRLFVWESVQVVEVAKAPVRKENGRIVCEIQLDRPKQGVYYIGPGLQDLRMCFLGTEKKTSWEGNCAVVRELKVKESVVNRDLDKILLGIQARNQRFMEQLNLYQQGSSESNNVKMNTAKNEMKRLDDEKRHLHDSLRRANSPLYRLAALTGYQSYHNHGKQGQSEGVYIAEQFFAMVDFEDAVYSNTPFFYENVKNYASTLVRIGLTPEQQQQYLDNLWKRIPKTHPNHKALATGITLGMISNNNDYFLVYAKRYLDDHGNETPMLDNFLREQIAKIRGPLPIGEEALQFSGPRPDGTELSLKDLRGKVVLIDFWASWCGPCRRENPHVVGLYQKYKDKGFDILGVSLDTDRQRWLDAIQKDGLTWQHISDLRGWQSAAAQLYGVSGIPFTVLLDKDGKVLAKQLRGAALDNKLKEIFGY